MNKTSLDNHPTYINSEWKWGLRWVKEVINSECPEHFTLQNNISTKDIDDFFMLDNISDVEIYRFIRSFYPISLMQLTSLDEFSTLINIDTKEQMKSFWHNKKHIHREWLKEIHKKQPQPLVCKHIHTEECFKK